VKKIGADGKVIWVVDREHIARCRLRINTLFRIVALLTPPHHKKVTMAAAAEQGHGIPT
jgi:hypothetical protein